MDCFHPHLRLPPQGGGIYAGEHLKGEEVPAAPATVRSVGSSLKGEGRFKREVAFRVPLPVEREEWQRHRQQ